MGPGKGDDETRTFITQTYQRAEALMFGRRTCEVFAGSWRSIGQMRAHPIGVALNEAPKYVASTTLTAPRWEDTTTRSGRARRSPRRWADLPDGRIAEQMHQRLLAENPIVVKMANSFCAAVTTMPLPCSFAISLLCAPVRVASCGHLAPHGTG
jgi:hypothetical protein